MKQKLQLGEPTRLLRQRGFTLIETIVVAVIVGVVLSVSYSLLLLERTNRFDGHVQATLAELRNLQSQAKIVDDNKEFGMSFTASSWTSFSRDPVSGTQITIRTRQFSDASLATVLNPSGTQVVFARLTGRPSATTTLTFSRTNPSRSAVVKVEASGVSYVQ